MLRKRRENNMACLRHDITQCSICSVQDGTVWNTKDSGERQQFSTGMQRDIQTNKPRYDLVDWPMITRWAKLMQRGALKYGEHNWKKAETEEELNRFMASALRHCIRWYCGDNDEDHAAAVMFNLGGAEMVKAKLKKGPLAF